MRSFVRVPTLAILALCLSPAPTGSGQAEQKQEERYQFRVTVDLISLNVTVTDSRNRFVTELLQKDFSVYEDGVSQEISIFSREDLPIRLTLLIDTSASMDEKMSFAQEAAVNFVKTLKVDDLAEVMEFGSKPTILQAATSDTEKLSRAIRMTQAGGTTSLYNALYIALKNLNRRREDIRRQAIVVLSDGEDTSSLVSFEQVMELAKDTDVVIYTISLRKQNARRGRAFSEAEHVLKKLAEETGGQWFFPNEIQELESVYERISSELKSQYNLGYVSNNPKRDGSWRRVVVQTSFPDLVVRTKLGYYAPRAN
jgi:VWFA-related protein